MKYVVWIVNIDVWSVKIEMQRYTNKNMPPTQSLRNRTCVAWNSLAPLLSYCLICVLLVDMICMDYGERQIRTQKSSVWIARVLHNTEMKIMLHNKQEKDTTSSHDICQPSYTQR